MRFRTASVTALATLAVAPAAAVAKPADADVRIPLPAGWQPEGIAAAPGGDLYVGSLATGDVLRLDPRTGTSRTAIDAPDGAQANGLERFAKGTVVVTGNRTGEVNVYREKSGKRLLSARPAPAGEESFTNDVAVRGSSAYVTDSSRPFLYTVKLRKGRTPEVTSVPLTGITYGEGINLNGIAAGPRGRLYAVQSNTGKLFSVKPGSGALTEVDTGGYALTNGDGIEFRGRTAYVVQNRTNTVAVLKLAKNGRSAKLVRKITSPDFDVPTTAAFLGRKLFAVNARFGTAAPTTADYWVTRLGKQK